MQSNIVVRGYREVKEKWKWRCNNIWFVRCGVILWMW